MSLPSPAAGPAYDAHGSEAWALGRESYAHLGYMMFIGPYSLRDHLIHAHGIDVAQTLWVDHVEMHALSHEIRVQSCALRDIERDPPPQYRCNCGESFREHLARVAHAATCPAVVCRDVFPPHLNPPPAPPAPPRRCALPVGHDGDHCADRRPGRLSVTWINTGDEAAVGDIS